MIVPKPRPANRKKRFHSYLVDYFEKKVTGYTSIAVSTIVATGKFCFGYLVYSSLWMYSGIYSAAGVLALLVAALFQTRKWKQQERCYWLTSAIMCLRSIAFDLNIMNRTSAFQAVWISNKRVILLFEAIIFYQYVTSLIGLTYSKRESRPIVASIQWMQLSNALINTLLYVHLIIPFFFEDRAAILLGRLVSNYFFGAVITILSIYMVIRSMNMHKFSEQVEKEGPLQTHH